MSLTGRVVRLTRFPVKSMLGEDVPDLALERLGPAGDHIYALRDLASGLIITGKKPGFHEVLHVRARWSQAQGMAEVVRGKESIRVDHPATGGILSHWLGREVAFVRRDQLDGAPVRTVRPTLVMDPGTLADAAPVHLITTATLRRLEGLLDRPVDPARFRANILLNTDASDEAWVGREIRIGGAVLHVHEHAERCAFPMLAQGALPADPSITRTIAKHFGNRFGLYARVIRAGRSSLGDRALPA